MSEQVSYFARRSASGRPTSSVASPAAAPKPSAPPALGSPWNHLRPMTLP